MTTDRTILIASPHGFCAGVERAVRMAEALLERYPHPIYCLREIVHNRLVIDGLAAKGMVFVQDIAAVPRGATLLFSAHGVSPATRQLARDLNLRTVDATCPFVTRIHNKVLRYASRDYRILLVGDRHHDEIVAVASEAPDRVAIVSTAEEARTVSVPDAAKVAVMTQTTLSLDEVADVLAILRERFPALEAQPAADICYATRNRQQAARQLAGRVDRFVILGAENSSNSNRLAKVVRAAGCPAHLASSIPRLAELEIDAVNTLGLTAGASTPESFVHEAIAHLKTRGFSRVQEFMCVEEDVHFPLPRDL
jgi:4-hydroxy-3-methylbut-2-enyl diphosphate reductase